MNILVINCGSSSLKYQLINSESEEVLAKGLCERIGIDGSCITHQPKGGEKVKTEIAMPTHTQAVAAVIEKLTDEKVGVVKSLAEIDAVGHRIVHGGEKFASSVVIDAEVMKAIEDCNDLAPLHNPANLIGINSCKEIMPDVPMVAVFGTSHDFVSNRVAEIMGRKREDLKIIVCHLGNGASVSAVKNGKCVDTSMGLTPLEGLIMGTRSGDIDPAIVSFLADKEGKTADEIINICNKKSGVLGLSGGVSSDFRDLAQAAADGNEKADIALKTWAYHVAKYVGAYAAAMNGVDVIAFTAGVGENNVDARAEVCSYLGYLGVTINAEANKKRGEEVEISTPDSTTKVYVVPTDEELAIARETARLVK